MLRARFIFTVLVLLFTFMPSGSAQARLIRFTLLELTEKSDLIFVGEVSNVGKDTAAIKTSQVLSGKLDSSLVTVTPVYIQYDFGRRINFTIGEKVMIYGRNTGDGRVVVLAEGHGKITLGQKNEETDIAAAKRLVQIASLKGEHEKNLAMLAEARRPNERLRSESRFYTTSTIAYSEFRQKYIKELVDLIDDSNPEIQRIGLQGLRFIEAKGSIVRMVELTRSEDLNVVSAASMALAKYDTPETVAALIPLTKHKEYKIKMRASIDLDNSRRPEAKEALKKLLYDEDPKVRAAAPRRFISWLRRNEADDVLPRLVEMLNDPSTEVRASAAQCMGESRNSSVVVPLIEELKKDLQDEKVKRFILSSLRSHYSRGDAKTRELIDEIIELVIDALKKGGPNDAFGPSFQAVGILSLSDKKEAKDALRWAAESHPNDEIRAYAERSLAK